MSIFHLERGYKTPVVSFGLILFAGAPPKFLLYQRRDTFEYMDFLRGVWTENQLEHLFSLMSNEERDRLSKFSFAELWDDLWIDHGSKIYLHGRIRGERKFERIRHKIPFLLEKTVSHTAVPPWGFPKGKKNMGESPVECALREFEEETNIPAKGAKVVDGVTFTEKFKGSNGRDYVTHYFLAKMDEAVLPGILETPKGIRKVCISDEASAVGWFSLEEALEKLNLRRGSMLRSCARATSHAGFD